MAFYGYALLSVTDCHCWHVDMTECFDEDDEVIECPLSQSELVERVNAQLDPGCEPWWFEETGDKEIDSTATDASISFGDEPKDDDVELLGKACYDTFLERGTRESEFMELIED